MTQHEIDQGDHNPHGLSNSSVSRLVLLFFATWDDQLCCLKGCQLSQFVSDFPDMRQNGFLPTNHLSLSPLDLSFQFCPAVLFKHQSSMSYAQTQRKMLNHMQTCYHNQNELKPFSKLICHCFFKQFLPSP